MIIMLRLQLIIADLADSIPISEMEIREVDYLGCFI